MALWYRAHNSASLKYVFSGEGGLYVAGRWNHKGRKVIYCSNSISLCTLEWLAHNGLSVSGFSYHRFEINVPDKLIRAFSVKDMPKAWKQAPATNITRDFAEEHLFEQTKHIAIAVPSAMVPEEYNLVINPMHKETKSVLKSIKKLGRYNAPER